MKKLYKALLVKIFISLPVLLTAQKTELDLTDLKPPVSPGFTILDVAPNAIERPKTAKELVISTTSLFNNGFTIPKNFAFEIVPGWLLNNRGLSFKQLTGLVKKTDQPLRQNVFAEVKLSSLSIASVYSQDATPILAANTNHIGYGIKTNLLKVYAKKRLQSIDQYLKKLDRVNEDITANINIDSLGANRGIANKLRDSTKGYWDNIIALRTIRPLFQLQVALASSLAFPDNKGGQFHRGGGWVTGALNFPLVKSVSDSAGIDESTRRLIKNKNYFSFIVLGRGVRSAFDSVYLKNSQNIFDIGARAELEMDRLVIGAEYLLRRGNNNFENTYRFAGMIEYRVIDNVYIMGTFGRNFGNFNNVIALFGLNWGFGKESIFRSANLDQ